LQQQHQQEMEKRKQEGETNMHTVSITFQQQIRSLQEKLEQAKLSGQDIKQY